MASHQPNPRTPRFARGPPEFDRVLEFFDGTYAVALTLLVTTLDPTDVAGAWSDPGALWVAIGTEVVAFFLAFAVVAFYGRSNHAFVARLHHLSGRLVTVDLGRSRSSCCCRSASTRWAGFRSRSRRPSPPGTSR